MDEYNGMPIDKWPCPIIDGMYKAGDHSWLETCAGFFWYALEVLPPARMKQNAFMIGECWTHDENGAIYQAVVSVGDIFSKDNTARYFTRNAPIRSFDPAAYTAEIKKQFGIA